MTFAEYAKSRRKNEIAEVNLRTVLEKHFQSFWEWLCDVNQPGQEISLKRDMILCPALANLSDTRKQTVIYSCIGYANCGTRPTLLRVRAGIYKLTTGQQQEDIHSTGL